MKTAQKVLSFLLVTFLFLGTSGVAHAEQVTSFVVELGDTRPSPTSTTYTFDFTHITSATLFAIQLDFCTTPSGTCTYAGVTTEGGSNATEGTITGLDPLEWSVVETTGQNGLVRLENHGDGEDPGASQPISIGLGAIVNQSITSCESGNSTSDTCYVRLESFSDIARTSSVDEGIASYTVVAQVTVEARVDPLFTFTIAADAADQVHNDITTTAASTFSALDFGNLTANTPSYIAHALTVTTNTENGYTIETRMVTQMTGVYASNNIDPFGATGATWATPIGWTEPTGTSPSVDTGWIGANTTDTDVSQFDAEEFGPIDSTNRTVMSESGSDDGSTTVYVTYGIEANVFQPADSYTGFLVYTALPTY